MIERPDRLRRVLQASRRVPAPVLGFGEGVGYAGLVEVVDGERSEWSAAVLRATLWTLFATASVWWSRRRRELRAVETVDDAVRTGRLPQHADPDELRAGLLHVKRTAAQLQRWGVALALAGAAVSAGLAVGTHARELGSGTMIVTGVCLLAAVLLHLGCRWRAADVDLLLAELDGRTVR